MKVFEFHTHSCANQSSSEMRACLEKKNPKITTRDNIHPSNGGKKLLHIKHLDSAAVDLVCCTSVPIANYSFVSTGAR